MKKDEVIRRARRLKLRLAAGGTTQRLLVPLVEVAEFWLSHGFSDVVIRARLRLAGQTTMPAPVRYVTRQPGAVQSELVIPPSSGTPIASIVVPVMNNAAMTRDCLASIIAETPAGQYEVIVVDNASDGHTRSMLATVQGLRLIRNVENMGFVGACNQGAGAATGEFVLFLNNDTVVRPGWFEPLVRTFAGHRAVGAVGSRLVYPNGRLQEAGSIIWSDGEGWNYGHNQDPNAPEYNYVREVDYCSGASLMVRRSLFDELGGFDDRYHPAYYEDVDLAFRLREIGYRVLVQPASTIIHFGGATSGTDTGSGFKVFQVINHKKFKERHAAALATQCEHDPDSLRIARDRSRGPRVLIVDHMVPHHDQDAGSVRMMAIFRILLDLGCRVTFLPDNLAEMQPYASELQQLGVELLHGPIPVFAYLEKHRQDFDVAILCRARFAARYLPAVRGRGRGPYIIFDTVDLHYLREQRMAELENDPRLFRAAAETRDLEMGVVRGSDMVWLTSTHEAEVLSREPSMPAIGIVPMIHETRSEVPPFADRRDLLFIGGFRHPPNEDAVVYFVKEIFPLIRPALPGVRLHVVGPNPPPTVLRLASADVIIRGFVQDLEPVFDACMLSVAPLRYGAGVKGKITQSLAWGLPAIATPVAAEGMKMVDGEHLMVASTPSEFAARVVEVYRNEALWQRLSTGGRRHIDEHLGYESVRTAIKSILEQATNHG